MLSPGCPLIQIFLSLVVFHPPLPPPPPPNGFAYEIHSHNTRQTQTAVYFKPRVKKSIGKELLVYRSAKLWENVHSSIKSLSWYSFKKRFKRRLISNYVET